MIRVIMKIRVDKNYGMFCDECGRQSDEVVQLGEKPYWESSTINVCYDCLRKAMATLDKKEE